MGDVTELRPLMFSVAYGMLGSVSEAEDVTQEALLRMVRESEPIRTPAAFAVTITTRLAIDQLRSARARREIYVGNWLPEPLVTSGPDGDPPAHAEFIDHMSTAFLLLLERLSPVERAVLLLREAFEYGYDRIAEIVGKSEANCRQILVRAKARVREPKLRFEPSPARRDELVRRFFHACESGDLAGLELILAEDIEFVGDGGGRVPALATPAVGRLRVARFLLGLFKQARGLDYTVEPVTVNGGPGGRASDVAGRVLGVFSLRLGEAGIEAIYNVINPDKLRHLAGDARGAT